MVRRFSCVLLGLILMSPPIAWAQGTAGELAKVWEATRHFDKAVQGPLNIAVDDGHVSGSIGNYQATSNVIKGLFTLDFGLKAGQLKGELSDDGKVLNGHWLQPSNGKFIFTPYVTPVSFNKSSHGFEGEVRPLEDHITLYMLVGKQSDKGHAVEFINPQSNRGRFFTSAALKIKNDKAELYGQLRWHKKPQTLANGFYDQENNTLSLYLPFMGGSFDFTPADSNSHYWPKEKGAKYQYRQPVGFADQWSISDAKSEGVDDKKLSALVQSIIDNPPRKPIDGAVHAVLVARNGKLILEEYFNGVDRNTLHDTRSASKSLTGTLVGMAQYAGVPINLDDRLYPIMSGKYPDLTFDKQQAKITLQDVLTMSTGLDCDDNNDNSPGHEDTMQSQQKQSDWFRYMLDLKMVGQPGETTAYCSGGINLAGGVLAQKAKMWLPTVIDRYFAKPLGIKRYHINMMANAKEAYSGGGIRLTARGFLKLGQLMLDGGKWQGKQLIDPDYAALAISPLKSMFGQRYGLGWWLKDFEVEGKTKTVFYAGGNGGQQIVADPESGLLMVFFGGAYSTKGTYYARDTLVPKYLLNAVIE